MSLESLDLTVYRAIARAGHRKRLHWRKPSVTDPSRTSSLRPYRCLRPARGQKNMAETSCYFLAQSTPRENVER